jgi:uncharacterized protein (TIGR02117 family)
MLRRWARRIALGLLIVLGLFAVAAVVTARPGDPALWPAQPGTETIEIAVVNHGYHAGVVLPRAALAQLASRHGHGALIAVTERFGAYTWLEIGWGDDGFYRLAPTLSAVTLPLAARALFKPGNPSVLHVVGLGRSPRDAFPQSDVIAVPLSAIGFERLAARIEATFMRGPGGRLSDAGPGLYGPSLFYPAVGTFSILRVCNHWIADLLDAAGIPTTPVLATLPRGLIFDLHWRAVLR